MHLLTKESDGCYMVYYSRFGCWMEGRLRSSGKMEE